MADPRQARTDNTPPSRAEERPNRQNQEGQGGVAVMEEQETLQSRLSSAEQQRDEYRDLLLRTRADFENYQKRFQRDLAEERRYAHAPFARELLVVLDNLQRTLDAAQEAGESGTLVQGVALVRAEMLHILSRFGITPFESQNTPFDPNTQEAVLQQPRSDLAPGTVIRTLEPGYRLGDRILRPARVVVASQPPSSA